MAQNKRSNQRNRSLTFNREPSATTDLALSGGRKTKHASTPHSSSDATTTPTTTMSVIVLFGLAALLLAVALACTESDGDGNTYASPDGEISDRRFVCVCVCD